MSALRPFVFLLVLANVLFVHLTGAVETDWLLLLYGLTLASPLLQRLHDRPLAVRVWNLTVCVIFVMLMRHALTTGLLHMLEDGLLLATLCQVHLLNNLGPRQRPDLLFFNSFLIAFITSFFCQSLSWSLTFVAYTAVLVPALQVFAVLRTSGRADRGLVAGIVRDSVPRTISILAVTGVLYLFLPRDFEREGWIGENLIDPRLSRMEVGFSDELRLDRSGQAALSDAEVMRIRPIDGGREQIPLHWRGATFDDCNGTHWAANDSQVSTQFTFTDPLWRQAGKRTWQRTAETRRAALQVRLLDRSGKRVFLPLDAVSLSLPDRPPVEVMGRADGTVTVNGGPPVLADVWLGDAPARPPFRLGSAAERRLAAFEPDRVHPAVLSLAEKLRGELPAGIGRRELAESFATWLASSRRYALPGSPEAAQDLAGFLLGHGGGHCELFAASLLLMLRAHGVPCRLVTGYLAHEWDATRGEIVVRRRDAHAWVEVGIENEGWSVHDPTPANAMLAARDDRGGGWWQASVQQVQQWWAGFAGFDRKSQGRFWTYVTSLPHRLQHAVATRPGWFAMALLMTALLVLRLRRRGETPELRALRAALRRCRLSLDGSDTPRELLGRAVAAGLPAKRCQRLRDAVARHERACFRPAGRR